MSAKLDRNIAILAQTAGIKHVSFSEASPKLIYLIIDCRKKHVALSPRTNKICVGLCKAFSAFASVILGRQFRGSVLK